MARGCIILSTYISSDGIKVRALVGKPTNKWLSIWRIYHTLDDRFSKSGAVVFQLQSRLRGLHQHLISSLHRCIYTRLEGRLCLSVISYEIRPGYSKSPHSNNACHFAAIYTQEKYSSSEWYSWLYPFQQSRHVIYEPASTKEENNMKYKMGNKLDSRIWSFIGFPGENYPLTYI